MKYKELLGKSTKDANLLLETIYSEYQETFVSKSDPNSLLKVRKNCKKNIARIKTYLNSIGERSD
jgi:ribosomal protein L29